MPIPKKLSVKMAGLPQVTIVPVRTDFPGHIVNLVCINYHESIMLLYVCLNRDGYVI